MENEQQKFNDWSIELFVGNNYDYYKKKWQNKSESEIFGSWNWVAFFFPVYWMVYRKMYLEALLYFMISSAFSCCIPLSCLVFHVLAGIFGNCLYFNKALRTIKRASRMMHQEAGIYIKKHGETSIPSVVLTIFIVIVSSLALSASIFFFYSINGTFSQTVEKNQPASKRLRLEDEKVYQVTTKNGEITYTVPTDFIENENSNQDLHCYSDSRDLGISVILYYPEDFSEEITEQLVIDYQVNLIQNTYQLTPLTDADLPELDSHILQTMYSSDYEGAKIYWHISCRKLGKRYALVLITSFPSKWSKARDLYGDIINSAELAAKEL